MLILPLHFDIIANILVYSNTKKSLKSAAFPLENYNYYGSPVCKHTILTIFSLKTRAILLYVNITAFFISSLILYKAIWPYLLKCTSSWGVLTQLSLTKATYEFLKAGDMKETLRDYLKNVWQNYFVDVIIFLWYLYFK